METVGSTPSRVTPYTGLISELAPGHDPRHVEAFLRLEYGTLDHLDRATFRREVKIAVACIQQGGVDDAEALAVSYGL